MSHKGTSHVDPHFIECFSEAIKSTRDVFLASDGQPFILSGSGTLGWDLTAANFIQPGDEALIVNTGLAIIIYFSLLLRSIYLYYLFHFIRLFW